MWVLCGLLTTQVSIEPTNEITTTLPRPSFKLPWALDAHLVEKRGSTTLSCVLQSQFWCYDAEVVSTHSWSEMEETQERKTSKKGLLPLKLSFLVRELTLYLVIIYWTCKAVYILHSKNSELLCAAMSKKGKHS